MTVETITIDSLSFQVRRSARRRTLGLTVDRDGSLLLHAPTSAQDERLKAWVRSKLLWVHQKLAVKHETLVRGDRGHSLHGSTIYYLGHARRLRVVDAVAEPLSLTDGGFRLYRPREGEFDHLLRAWMIETGGLWLRRRVVMQSERTGLEPSGVLVGDLGNRWGSCARTRRIRFNWRLLHMPINLIDYVIVHELTHLVEPSHDRRFWDRLDSYMPGRERYESDLRSMSRQYLFARPRA